MISSLVIPLYSTHDFRAKFPLDFNHLCTFFPSLNTGRMNITDNHTPWYSMRKLSVSYGLGRGIRFL